MIPQNVLFQAQMIPVLYTFVNALRMISKILSIYKAQ